MSVRQSDTETQLRELDALAKARRYKFIGSIREAQDYLRPASVKQRATNQLLDTALDGIASVRASVSAYPLRAAGIAAFLGAVLVRGPLLRLAAKGIASGKGLLVEKYHQHRQNRRIAKGSAHSDG